MIKGRLQSKGTSGTTVTSLAPVFTTANQKGNMILVVLTSQTGSTNDITSITDTQGNSYARVLSNSDGTNNLDVWYAFNIIGGADTVTVNFSSTTASVLIAEYTGVTREDPKDVTASAAGASSPDSSGNTSTTANAKEIVIGFVGTNAALWTSYTAGAGFSNGLTQANGGARPALAIEDKLIDTVGAQAATFTVAGSTTGVVVGVATFKLAIAGFSPNSLRPHAFSPGLAR